MSLDGCIADAQGGTGFLVSDPTYDSAPFFASIDTVLMGRITYEQARREGMKAYPRLANYVVSRTLRAADYPEVTILGEDAERRIAALHAGPGKDIWLCGGGVLCKTLLAAEYAVRYGTA
jgi:dihydrofolate reductase